MLIPDLVRNVIPLSDPVDRAPSLAWISTARNWANILALSGLLDEAERAVIGDGFVEESAGKDDGQVGTAVESHRDFAFGDGDVGRPCR
jgi:hypothetical protein